MQEWHDSNLVWNETEYGQVKDIRRELQTKVREDFTIRAISWLKAPTSVFTFKTLLRHYAKQEPKHGIRCLQESMQNKSPVPYDFRVGVASQ